MDSPGHRPSRHYSPGAGSRSVSHSPSGRVRGTMPFGTQTPRSKTGRPKKNSFDKIMQSLVTMFPGYRSTDIKQFIYRLREQRGNTLAGMNLQEIVTGVADLIMEQSQGPVFTPQRSIGMCATSGMSANPPDFGQSDEIFKEEEEDPCIICYEEMTAKSTIQVKCGHRFHEQCIHRWMKEQSTCPTCRKHILLNEDFPPLS